mmetsp:Transcript_79145/g.220010  ORF Transcript_79145/g.220010 Transcript_79145/m.220010 type:complete len:227 (-) Transcript_79145:1035-1715(-)
MRGDAKPCKHKDDVKHQVQTLNDVTGDDGEQALLLVLLEDCRLDLTEVVRDDDEEYRTGGSIDGHVQQHHAEQVHRRVDEAIHQGRQDLRQQRLPRMPDGGHREVEKVHADRAEPPLEHLEHVEDDVQFQEGLPPDVVVHSRNVEAHHHEADVEDEKHEAQRVHPFGDTESLAPQQTWQRPPDLQRREAQLVQENIEAQQDAETEDLLQSPGRLPDLRQNVPLRAL